MSPTAINESQIQSEIDELKIQFPQTRDLYREACVLLFFRYGITPTANKLYQYVRKGSMSAPAEALNKFWRELRDKSRLRLEHPDIPQNLSDAAGKFIGELWAQAQVSAQSNFDAQISEAEDKVALAQQESAAEQEKREKREAELELTRADLKNALLNLAESEKNHAVDISALARLEKSLLELQEDRTRLERGLDSARLGFRADLEKVSASLAKAEERYRALEARSLLEVDKERQVAKSLQKEILQLRSEFQKQERLHAKELTTAHKVVANLREQLGIANGQFRELQQHHKLTTKKAVLLEKKLGTRR